MKRAILFGTMLLLFAFIFAGSASTSYAADLELTKTVNNTTPNLGQSVNFTITVRNDDGGRANNVRVTDQLPSPNLIYVSHTVTQGSYNNTTGIWNVGDINGWQSATLRITAIANTVGTTTNTARTGCTEDPDNGGGDDHHHYASATITVPAAADLKVNKTVNNTTPNFGQSVIFRINVTNSGPSNANGVNLTDLLPAGLIYQSHTVSQGTYNNITGLWNIGNLNNGATVSLNITALVNGTGSITNNANATGAQFDRNLTNNRANATINVPQAADLRVTKTVNNAAPNYLGNVVFTVTVTNAGPNNATGVSVSDLLPAGLVYLSSSATQGSYANGTGLWTIGNLNVGSVASLNITALVNRTGSFVNNASVTGSQFDQNLTNNNASATVNVPLAADLRVTKTVNNSAPNYLGNVVFTVTVTNAGPNNATGVSVSDLLPAGLSWISDNSGGAYNHVTGLWTIGNLNVGSVALLNITALINGTGSMTNVANVSGSQFDQNLTNNNASATVNVPPAADIRVTKAVNNSAPNYLGNVVFTVTVTNAGPNTGVNTRVSDLLPAGLLWVSDDSSGAYDHTTGLWTVGNLANGASATLNIVAQVLGHNTTITNRANGSSDVYDWNTANNNGSAIVTVPPAADIAVTKVVDNAAPNYLGNVVFTVTVTNAGPDTAVNARVSDLLPAGFGFVSATPSVGSYDSGTGLWSVDDLANGASATLQLVAQVLASNTTLTNLANGSSNIYDWNLTNNNGSASVTVPPAADIAVTKDVNNTAPNYRDNVTFTVIVRNDGPDDATGVSLDDLLPAGLSWVSDDSSGAYDPVTGVWTIGGLADGASATLNIVAQVLGHNTNIDNVANASASEFDPNLSNNRANVTINVPAAADIAVTKTVNNATPNYLGNVVFTVTVQNNGPDDATGVKLSDLLPAGLVWISDNASTGSYDHVTGIWDIGNLFMEQGPVTLTITAQVNKTGNITNIANASSDLYDWNLTNNVANATVSIPQTSELVLSKTVDKAKVVVGSTVKYTITVVNNGPDAALNTVVTDILPSGMQYLSSIASTGSYDPATGLWTIGTMANGATETLEIFVKVLATGTYENVATVSSDSSNPGTNSSGVVIDVIRNGTNGTNGSGTVPMQHTGIPVALLAFALVMMVAGIAIPKRK